VPSRGLRSATNSGIVCDRRQLPASQVVLKDSFDVRSSAEPVRDSDAIARQVHGQQGTCLYGGLLGENFPRDKGGKAQ
jgi:hypothetical protein